MSIEQNGGEVKQTLPEGVTITRHMGDTLIFRWISDEDELLVMAYIDTDEAIALAHELLRKAGAE